MIAAADHCGRQGECCGAGIGEGDVGPGAARLIRRGLGRRVGADDGGVQRGHSSGVQRDRPTERSPQGKGDSAAPRWVRAKFPSGGIHARLSGFEVLHFLEVVAK